MKLSVLIPVYNERIYLKELFNRVVNCCVPQSGEIQALEIIVVDDGSTDGSKQWLLERLSSYQGTRKDGVKITTQLVIHNRNYGKGKAIRSALAASHGDLVLIQDSDLEYSPEDYSKLLQPIINGSADAVYGSRFVGDLRRIIFFWHAVFNRFLTNFSNISTNLNLTDMGTCYKAISGTLARSLRLKSNDFGIEPEITARLAKLNARIYEVPVRYFGRTYSEGKKIKAWDGVKTFWHIFKFNFVDRDPIQSGISQSLYALDAQSAQFYYPQLKKGLHASGLGERIDLKILEIGSGIGSITQYLFKYGSVVATDIDPKYVESLRQRFHWCDFFRVEQWDASQPAAESISKEKYDVIVAFNVLEHIKNDVGTLEYWRSLLAPGGILIVLVPWGPALFNVLDAELGHFRRYSAKSLIDAIKKSGLQKVVLFKENPLGIPGWFLNGNILKRRVLPAGQVSLYAKIKFFVWPFEQILKKFIGINLVVVARSPKIGESCERE